MDPKSLLHTIDHTYLKPEGGPAEIRRLCREAREYGFYAVCIHPAYVTLAARELADSPVLVATVVGFPLGANTSRVKAFEAEEAVRAGAREIDMVLNVGLLKEGDYQAVEEDIREVVTAGGVLTKVILETALLDDEEIRTACRLAEGAGAHFVKTSTGFGPGGATPSAVRIMKETVGDRLGVKASGGIRNLEDVRNYLALGADRIGTSSGVAIARALGV